MNGRLLASETHAEILIMVQDYGTTDPRSQPNDVNIVKTNLEIRIDEAVRTSYIAKPSAEHGVDGLRQDGLAKAYLERTCRYRFDRENGAIVRHHLREKGRQPDVFTRRGKVYSHPEIGRMNDIDAFLEHRLSSPNHLLFGAEGTESWYSTPVLTHATLDAVWDHIEEVTDVREVNVSTWPWTPVEMSRFLVISTQDMTVEEGASLAAAETAEIPSTDPEAEPGQTELVTLQRHTWACDWANVLGLSAQQITDIRDPDVLVDIRATQYDKDVVLVPKDSKVP